MILILMQKRMQNSRNRYFFPFFFYGLRGVSSGGLCVEVRSAEATRA